MFKNEIKYYYYFQKQIMLGLIQIIKTILNLLSPYTL